MAYDIENLQETRSLMGLRKTGASLATFAVGTAIGWATFGAASYTFWESGDNDILAQHTTTLTDEQTALDETQHNLDRQEEAVGEACVSVLRIYVTGGALAGAPPTLETRASNTLVETVSQPSTPEENFIADLKDKEAPICGNSQTEVRTVYRAYATQTDQAIAQQNKISKHQNTLVGITNDAMENESDQGRIAGMIVGGFIGLCCVPGTIRKVTTGHWSSYY